MGPSPRGLAPGRDPFTYAVDFASDIECEQEPDVRLLGGSAADAELVDDLLVAGLVLALHVVEQLAAQSDHFEQATA